MEKTLFNGAVVVRINSNDETLMKEAVKREMEKAKAAEIETAKRWAGIMDTMCIRVNNANAARNKLLAQRLDDYEERLQYLYKDQRKNWSRTKRVKRVLSNIGAATVAIICETLVKIGFLYVE